MLKWLRDRFDLMLNGYTEDDVFSLCEKMNYQNIVIDGKVDITPREKLALIDLQAMNPAKLREIAPIIATLINK